VPADRSPAGDNDPGVPGSWPQVAIWREYWVDMTLVFAARKNILHTACVSGCIIGIEGQPRWQTATCGRDGFIVT